MSSLENGLAILGLLTADRSVLRVGEVCRRLDMPKSSVSRLLTSLCSFGLVERTSDGAGYVVGPRALGLAASYSGRHRLLDHADRLLDALIADFGFTGYVSVLSGRDVVLLRVRHGSYPLRHVREVGSRLPALRTAMGQALIARLADSEVETRFFPDTGTEADGPSFAALRSRLTAIRRRGVIIAPSVLTPGVTTIATTLADPAARDAIAIALGFPERAADRAAQQRMTEVMLAAVAAAGRRIGDLFWSNR